MMNAQKIAILTDSCADISPDLAKQYNIYTLPLCLSYDDGDYWDGVDITPEEVYRRMPQQMAKTSLPSGGRIEDLLNRIHADGYEKVLAIIFSSALSGTYNMVRLMSEAYSGMEVAVFDTRSGSLGSGVTALQAAQFLEQGHTWDELLRVIPQLIIHTKVFFAIDTLEYLQKGGRIGRIAAVAGAFLNIKPVITLAPDGQLTSAAKVRGRKQSIERMVACAVESVPPGVRYNLVLVQGNAPPEFEEMKSLALQQLPSPQNLWEGEISCTLGAYVGPHLLGIGVQVLPDNLFLT